MAVASNQWSVTGPSSGDVLDVTQWRRIGRHWSEQWTSLVQAVETYQTSLVQAVVTYWTSLVPAVETYQTTSLVRAVDTFCAARCHAPVHPLEVLL